MPFLRGILDSKFKVQDSKLKQELEIHQDPDVGRTKFAMLDQLFNCPVRIANPRQLGRIRISGSNFKIQI